VPNPDEGPGPSSPGSHLRLLVRNPSAGYNDRIAELDGWRGLSIVLVVLGHLVEQRYSSLQTTESPEPIGGALAHWGVCIFFVVSGFIITKLASEEIIATGRFSIFGFYIRRFARIVPPFFLYLACVFLFTCLGLISQNPTGVLLAAGFTCNLPGIDCGWFSGHSWSLAYEEQFYLIVPSLFLLSTRLTKIVLAIVLIGLMLFPILRYVGHLGSSFQIWGKFAAGFIFIAAGALASTFEIRLRTIGESHFSRYVTLMATSSLLATLILVLRSPALGSAEAYVQLALELTILPLSLTWLVVHSLHGSRKLGRFLRFKPILFSGRISYSLYLWQQLFTAHPSRYLADSWLQQPLLMLPLAILSYVFVERTSVRLGKKVLGYFDTLPVDERQASNRV
jgi:peptidoglycan/LPS O-acetylase OafA/YrhL